jgi:hypothetical protein
MKVNAKKNLHGGNQEKHRGHRGHREQAWRKGAWVKWRIAVTLHKKLSVTPW